MSTFVHPEYLYVFMVVFIALALIVPLYVVRRRRALRGYPALRSVSNSVPVECARYGALFVGLGAAAFIFLGLQYERRTTVPVVEGLEIAALLDCSQSMLAPVDVGDVKSRLSVVTSALEDALTHLKQDRWGLGCFSGKLNGVSPLTNDYEHLLRPKLLIMQDPRYIMAVGKGTSFGAALNGCLKIFNLKNQTTKKVCVILSDGEPFGETEALETALTESVARMKSEIARLKLDVAFYLVGVGNTDTPMKIPTYDAEGNPKGFATDKEGNAFLTRPDAEYLKKIADKFDGQYVHLGQGEQLSRLLDDVLNAERRIVGQTEEVVYVDATPPAIVLLICCLWFFVKCPKRFSDMRKLPRWYKKTTPAQ